MRAAIAEVYTEGRDERAWLEHLWAEARGPLRELGVDFGQGYYFARPMGAHDAARMSG